MNLIYIPFYFQRPWQHSHMRQRRGVVRHSKNVVLNPSGDALAAVLRVKNRKWIVFEGLLAEGSLVIVET